jgi:hypothetical protein
MKSLEEFLVDTITLHKQDGTVVKNIKVSIGKEEVTFPEIILRVEPEDRLIRNLPDGKTEEFVVDKASYSEAFHGVPAQWIVLYRHS